MKIFESLQNLWWLVGVKAPTSPRRSSLHAKNVIVFVLLGKFSIASSLAWLEVETFMDYAAIVYSFLTSSAVIVTLLVIVLQAQRLFELIGKLERTIEKRKFVFQQFSQLRLGNSQMSFYRTRGPNIAKKLRKNEWKIREMH